MINALWSIATASLTIAATVGAAVLYVLFVRPLVPISGNIELLAVGVGFYAASQQLAGAASAVTGAIQRAASK